MSESVASQSTDRSTDSGRRITRTYVRTHVDGLVQMSEIGCESNARETQTGGVVGSISAIQWGRSPRFAEVNGAKVIVAQDLPESVLHALTALVDAVQQEFGESEARRRAAEAERARPMCRWHAGQIEGFCGPCRSEQIGAW